MATSRKKNQPKASSILVFDREPPQSIESERAVLGAIFLDPESLPKVMEIFNYNIEDIFYYGPHQIIFEAMYDIYQNTQNKPDLQAVIGYLESKNLISEVGGISYLTELSTMVPTSANITYYATVVIESALKRKLIRLCNETVSNTYEGQIPLKQLLDETESKLFTIAMRRRTNPIYRIKEYAKEFIDELSEVFNKGSAITGIATGFPKLDEKLCGLQYSEMIVLAARPSVGKTAFALNIAHYVAKREEVGVLIFSLEMSKEMLLKRLISLEGNIDGQVLRRAFGGKKIIADIVRTSGELCKLPIYIDDTPGINVIELRSKARKQLQDDANIKLIIIDYLQLMSVHQRGENRQVEIAEISRQIKGLARELKIPILALCQLSREAERDTSEPKLSHLRESGAIEQDADVVMILYQDKKEGKKGEKEEEKKKDPITVKLKIAKQRNGPLDTIKFSFNRRYQRFLEIGDVAEEEEPSSVPYIDDEESPF